jgi:WD40 repeat protein
MSQRVRWAVFAVIALAVLTVVTAYAVGSATSYRRAHDRPPTVETAPDTVAVSTTTGPRVVFRHTGTDELNGKIATVPLDDPSGARAFTDLNCDRVYATATVTSCLRTERGVVTKYSLTEYAESGAEIQEVSVPGIPSRTRLSPDGSLVSTTTFVSGHSYMQVGFSTTTEIRDVGGEGHGNLERYTLVIDGEEVKPRDRNVWGVTFADDRTFYATVGTGGETYLVRGDLDARTLTSIAEHVECPSLSPDGTTIAFKEATERDGRTWWTPAVLDVATGRRTVLDSETRNVDDQIEWLDDDTLLYGLARDDEVGVSDVWSLGTDDGSRPQLFIQQASSPAVVRP